MRYRRAGYRRKQDSKGHYCQYGWEKLYCLLRLMLESVLVNYKKSCRCFSYLACVKIS